MYDLTYRPRRLRTSPEMRDLVRETTLDPTDLIYPLFIVPGEGIKKEIESGLVIRRYVVERPSLNG